ncbi:Holliday junction resolvase RuvX [Chloroflexota bacterium]
MGLDIGDKRIGMALSDPRGILATPLTIIERSDERKSMETIISIVNQYEIGRIIVGLPLSMDGSIGQQAEKVKTFVRELSNQINVPVEFMDERLTTVSAKRLMQETVTRRTREKARDDAIAAALILQSYLDERTELEAENSYGNN